VNDVINPVFLTSMLPTDNVYFKKCLPKQLSQIDMQINHVFILSFPLNVTKLILLPRLMGKS